MKPALASQLWNLDTNRIQKSCQATPQGTPGHPRPPQTIPRSSPAPPGHPRPKASKVCKSMENTSYNDAPGDTTSSKCLGFYCKIDNVLYEVGIEIMYLPLFYCHNIDSFVFLVKADQNQLVFIVPL